MAGRDVAGVIVTRTLSNGVEMPGLGLGSYRAAALRAGGVIREATFITSKLENDDQGYDSALRAFERTLANLAALVAPARRDPHTQDGFGRASP